jgi:hypothetical protein
MDKKISHVKMYMAQPINIIIQNLKEKKINNGVKGQ